MVEGSQAKAGDGAAKDVGFVEGMRRLAAGVSVVATEFEGDRYGLASTAVTSVSADPPTLLISVNFKASAHEAIKRAGCFTVNVLDEEDEEVAHLFGSKQERERRFLTRQWSPMATGAPALDGALAVFDCVVRETAVISTHTIFFGRVVDVRFRGDDRRPLLYWDRAYRKCATA